MASGNQSGQMTLLPSSSSSQHAASSSSSSSSNNQVAKLPNVAVVECSIDSDEERDFFADDPQDDLEEMEIHEEECRNYFKPDEDDSDGEMDETDIDETENAVSRGGRKEDHRVVLIEDDYDSFEENKSIVDLMSQLEEF